jgi:LEA14-like dessication related protein
VYPNPSKGVFSINGLNQTANAYITDMLGKTVINTFTITNNTPIVCNQLQAGVYLLHIKLNNGTQTHKITIK